MSAAAYLVIEKSGSLYQLHYVDDWLFDCMVVEICEESGLTPYALFDQHIAEWAKKGWGPELSNLTEEELESFIVGNHPACGKFPFDLSLLLDRDKTEMFECYLDDSNWSRKWEPKASNKPIKDCINKSLEIGVRRLLRRK